MVCEWGMSDKMGPLTFGKKEQEIFLGREISQHRDFSETTAIDIDREVRRLIVENYERAKGLLTKHMNALVALAEALLERESLDGSEVDRIVQQANGIPVAATA
jgi:cell division protease FtsH